MNSNFLHHKSYLFKSLYSVFLLITGFFLFYGNFLSQWIGISLIVYSGFEIQKFLRQILSPHIKSKIATYLPPIVIFSILLAVYHKFLLGKMPWSADHLVHETKAFVLFSKLLPTFRITGWTDFASSGYPANTLYPPGGSLLVSAIRFLTFGQLSWEYTYSLTIFGILTFYVFGFYYLGKKHISTAGGLLAALFALTNHGAFRQGGWDFMIRWGVWPLSVSLVLVLLSLDSFHDYLSDKKKTPLKSVLWGTAAIITHPFALLILFPSVFAASVLKYIKDGNLSEIIKKSILTLILIFLISSWWLVPFLTYAPAFSAHVSALAGNLHNAAEGLVNPAPWAYSWSWVGIPAILGMLWVLREFSSEFLTTLAFSALAFFTLGSSSVLSGLNLFSAFPALMHVQFPRFLIFIKAASFLSAAFFLTKLKFPLTKLKNPLLFKLILIPLLALLVIPLSQQFLEKRILYLSSFPVDTKEKEALPVLAGVIKKHAAEKHKGEFFRVALSGGFNDHRLASFPVYSGLPFVKLSYIPGETYIYRSHSSPAKVPRSASELKYLNVAYVVSEGPSRLPSLKKLKEIKGIFLYEFTQYSSKRIFADSSDVKILNFSDEHIKIKVSNVKSKFLRINVSPFSRWHAYINGKETEISEWKYKNLTFMQVPLKAGIIEFKYKNGFPDYTGVILTICGIIFMIMSIFSLKIHLPLSQYFRFSFLTEKFTDFKSQKTSLFKISKNIKYLLILLILVLTFTVIFILKTAPSSEHPFDLNNAKVTVIHKNGKTEQCTWMFPQRFICGKSWKYVGLESVSVNGEIKTGFLTNPLKDAFTVITFPDIKFKNLLKINYALTDSSGRHFSKGSVVFLEVRIGNKKIAALKTDITGLWKESLIDTGSLRNKVRPVSVIVHAPDIRSRRILFKLEVK